MPSIICFVGYHNTGKTTFIRKVVSELHAKGYKVAVIKSTHHHSVEEFKGKDTQLYLADGVGSVALISPDKTQITLNSSVRPENLARRLFSDFDIVICEGFKNSNLPKIEVSRKDVSENTLLDSGNINNILAIVSDFYTGDEVRSFGFEDYKKVADFIEEAFIKNKGNTVELIVDGEPIPMKMFVSETFKDVIYGYIKNLKGVKNPSNIEVKIHIL